MIDPGDARRQVRDSHDRLGSAYADWARGNDDPVRARYSALARETFPVQSHVLDLGCGDGSMLTAQLAEGRCVTGVDISPEQLRSASSAIPDARFICADITEIEFPEESFDGIVAFYCLTHVPQANLPDLIRNIARWLRPGGVYIGSFGTADETGSIEENWLGVPMFFSGFAPDQNRDLVDQVGLTIEHDQIETVIEFERETRFHWIMAKKPGHE